MQQKTACKNTMAIKVSFTYSTTFSYKKKKKIVALMTDLCTEPAKKKINMESKYVHQILSFWMKMKILEEQAKITQLQGLVQLIDNNC